MNEKDIATLTASNPTNFFDKLRKLAVVKGKEALRAFKQKNPRVKAQYENIDAELATAKSATVADSPKSETVSQITPKPAATPAPQKTMTTTKPINDMTHLPAAVVPSAVSTAAAASAFRATNAKHLQDSILDEQLKHHVGTVAALAVISAAQFADSPAEFKRKILRAAENDSRTAAIFAEREAATIRASAHVAAAQRGTPLAWNASEAVAAAKLVFDGREIDRLTKGKSESEVLEIIGQELHAARLEFPGLKHSAKLGTRETPPQWMTPAVRQTRQQRLEDFAAGLRGQTPLARYDAAASVQAREFIRTQTGQRDPKPDGGAYWQNR